MSKELNVLLDTCIDRMNEGESLEVCLACYPAYAEELEPLLRAMYGIRDTCSTMPGATAKSAARQRLDAALVDSERGFRELRGRPRPLFGWTRAWATVTIVVVLALVGFGLHWMLTPGVAPAVAQGNFRLLLSDEENAIGDFTSLEVTITSIGVLRGGESGGWEVIEFEPSVVVDLTRLQGLNAQEIWNGILTEGQYRKAFIYVEDATGTVNGESVNVIVPGNLQISKPFALTADDSVVSFVYDITVVAAGNEQSGIKYILLPQVTQSGANQEFHEVGEGELTLQVVEGTVAPGNEIAILVTLGATRIEGATVTVNDVELVDKTDMDGRISFTVPNEDELEIEVVKGDMEGALEIDLEREFQEGELALKIEGKVTPGGSVTVLVTFQGTPVPDALVMVNDGEAGTTGEDGRISFTVPYEDELEIEAVKDELEGELEINLGDELTLQIEDEVTPGESSTLLVTFQGLRIQGARVTVNDGEAGTTGEDGRISFTVPHEDELEIEAVKGELEGELEINLGDELTLQIEGEVTPGESSTLLVTFQGLRIQGARVTVNDEEAGTTNENGRISFTVPDDDELRIEVVLGELEGELEINLGGEFTNQIEGEVDEKALEQQLLAIFNQIDTELSIPLEGFIMRSENQDVKGDTLTYTARAVKDEVLELPPLKDRLLQDADGWKSSDIELSEDSLDITFKKEYLPVTIDSRTYIPSASVTISVTVHQDDGITAINYDVDITLEEP